MKKVRWKLRRLFCAALAAALLLTLAACGGGAEKKPAQEPQILDVLAAIDEGSITQDGVYTDFRVTTPDGKTIRFQGRNITLREDGIYLENGAFLASLDYIGEIRCFTVAGDTPEAMLNFGAVYADGPSVGCMEQLYAGLPRSFGLGGESEQDLSEYHSGFFMLKLEYAGALMTKLTLEYDPGAEQITYGQLDADSAAGESIELFRVWWNGEGEVLPEVPDETALADRKMEEPGALKSDIIAGIDLDSVTVDGTATRFSSVMSDGAVIRFEGTNIQVDESGITLCAGSTLTSLDALGQIYVYYAQMENDQIRAAETLEDPSGVEVAGLSVGFGYTYSADKTSVEHAGQVHTYPSAWTDALGWNKGLGISVASLAPNFVYVEADANSSESVLLTSLTVGYHPEKKVTAVTAVSLNTDMSGFYLDGERYDSARETWADPEEGRFEFYLILRPDTELADMSDPHRSIYLVPNTFFEVGELKDAEGHTLDKSNARVSVGTTLDLTVGDYELTLELPVLEKFQGAQTMHDLVPYLYPSAIGEKNVLVVPMVWADQTNLATSDTMALYRKALGRVMDQDGVLTDHSDPTDTRFSLSEYFDTASYGKMTVNSFLTDWHYSDLTFAEYEDRIVDGEGLDEIVQWIRETYPDLDWTRFDQDANGYVDSMVLINVGDSQSEQYTSLGYSGALYHHSSYYGDCTGTPERPGVNGFVSINHRFLKGESTGALLHEFSHSLGLIDYYDVNYSGINAVGGFDMQSDNVGDWNAYSKLAVGWMNPQVVTGLSSGESVELTIGSLALTGDVILLPAAGTQYEGPFSEYVMIDLLTDDGVNRYDAAAYGLSGVAGVRISHVNAWMERHVDEVSSGAEPGMTATFEVGTIHRANDYVDDGKGFYNIEVIQSGKVNTFTDLDHEITTLSPEDLFYAGDVFAAEEYSEFFYEGKLDSGEELGYTVTIVRVGRDTQGQPTATVRITAN